MKIGEVVTFVDSVGKEHDALVTNVFGPEGIDTPTINVVVVSDDDKMNDTYGRQIARFTSVVHQGSSYAHGYVWRHKV